LTHHRVLVKPSTNSRALELLLLVLLVWLKYLLLEQAVAVVSKVAVEQVVIFMILPFMFQQEAKR
jgi:hypothetical protein